MLRRTTEPVALVGMAHVLITALVAGGVLVADPSTPLGQLVAGGIIFLGVLVEFLGVAKTRRSATSMADPRDDRGVPLVPQDMLQPAHPDVEDPDYGDVDPPEFRG